MRTDQRAFRQVMAALLCALLLAGPLGGVAAAGPANDYASYRDVPGVTEEEMAAIDSLRQSTAFFTYGMTTSTECFRDADLITRGFAAIYCDWLSSFFDIKFKPVIYEWDALQRGIADHSIAFSGELSASLREEDGFFITDSIAERRIRLVSAEGSEKLAVLAHNRTLRYGFLEGTTTRRIVTSQAEQTFLPVSVKNYSDAYQKLLLGEIDALFMDETMEGLYSQYENLIIEDFLPLSYNRVAMGTSNPALAPFISVLQKYQRSAGSHRITQMYEEGRQQYLRHYLGTVLTYAEQGWLDEMLALGTPVAVAADPGDYPVSFYNLNEERWQGIAIDILEEIGLLTGLQFEYLDPATGSYPHTVEAVFSGHAQMVAGLIRSQDDQAGLSPAALGYQTDSYALISSSDFRDVSASDLPYVKVGLVEGAGYSAVFYELVPNHENTVTYATKEEAVEALRTGQIDLLMGTRNLLLDMTNYMELTGFKANLLLHRPYEVAFGFHTEQPQLRSLIGKAQELVDTELVVDEWTRNVFDYSGTLARAQRPFLLGMVALMFVVGVLLFILLLRNRGMAVQLEREVRQRTHELEVQTEAAQVASRAKGEFLARMSHEIRTPLNAIIGMTEVARRTDSLDKKNAALDEISTASNHLVGILNDVLDMSKIESGKFTLSYDAFDLATAMDEVVHIIAQRCGEKQLAFQTKFDLPAHSGVAGDKLRLKQVLINLLGNAVKFTDGGEIRLSVVAERQQQDRLTVSFRVEDTGIGISEEQIGNLFNAFEQADSSIAVRFGGTGLGLAISQSLVRQMGGEIEVDSVPGSGSVFRFRLELERVALPEAQAPAPAGGISLEGRRLLVVEDIEINRLIIMELLDDLALHIDEAADGREALALFGQSPPGRYDLILMDVQMPHMDGYEATRAIRALPRDDAKKVPIIAMTANAYREDIERALQAGMNDHLAKPVDVAALRETVVRWLGGQE